MCVTHAYVNESIELMHFNNALKTEVQEQSSSEGTLSTQRTRSVILSFNSTFC